MHPLLHLGPIELPTYGSIIFIGLVIGVLVAVFTSKKYNIEKLDIVLSTILASVGLIVGAKILYLITVIPEIIRNISFVKGHVLETISYAFGGFVFYGGLLGALFGTAEPDILNAAEIYLLVTALSFPAIGLYNACAALSRAMGDSKTTMLVSFGMDIFNIAGNAFFIFVMKWGVFGVALSTLLARVVSATVMLWTMRNPDREIRFSRNDRFRPDVYILKEIFRVGIPTGMDACVFQAGKIILQRLVVSLGTAGISSV